MNFKIEYLEIFNEIKGKNFDFNWEIRYKENKDRYSLMKKYSFAIPTKEAIRGIIKYNPIIEIGAGNGYWAYLINKFGGKIVAFDNNQRDKDWIKFKNHEYFTENWFDVKYGDEKEIDNYPNHTLFLCWIEYCAEYGLNCLKRYKGKYFIYIGEGKGGCCTTDDFFEYLYLHFKKKESFYIPNWHGIHDYLNIYERRENKK